jgi:hypothetical protein
MTGNTVFQKDIKEEKLGKTSQCNMNVAGDKNDLLGRTITNDENAIKLTGKGKLFKEVHGYRMPRTKRNRKRLQQTIRPMLRCLVVLADNT